MTQKSNVIEIDCFHFLILFKQSGDGSSTKAFVNQMYKVYLMLMPESNDTNRYLITDKKIVSYNYFDYSYKFISLLLFSYEDTQVNSFNANAEPCRLLETVFFF